MKSAIPSDRLQTDTTMPPRVEALVKKELLVWARESAGLTQEAAAKKVPVKAEKLIQWESGDARPSVPQLRKLANAYKRPLAVFYLPGPPKGFAAMHDFRRLPGEVAGTQSPALRRAIRQVHVRRQTALDLYRELEGEDPPEFALMATLNDDPEAVGQRVRDSLGVRYEDQIRWRGDEYEGFKSWRASLEAHGVAVFQVEDVATDEMRGFSISDAPLPAVVLNISDPVRARIFTMLHEAVHLTLRDGGLCDLDEEQGRPPEELRAEVFSNYAAGAVLMPRANLLAEPEVTRQVREDWPDGVIETLASRYCVSREALVRRLVLVGRTTNAFYLRKRQQYQREYRDAAAERARDIAARRAAGEKVGGGAPPHTMAVSTAGPLLTRLVLDGYEREIITASDVSDFLEIRLKHLPKVERAMLGAEP